MVTSQRKKSSLHEGCQQRKINFRHIASFGESKKIASFGESKKIASFRESKKDCQLRQSISHRHIDETG
jgi:hypothetical protein